MALSEDLLAEHSEQLSAYKSACEQHPDLKSFDSALQERTTKAIGDLTDESKNEPVSPYTAHKVISQHVIDVTESVTKFITEGDYNDFRESEALKGLVVAYFENTKETLEILNSIEKCVEEAEKGQRHVKEALIDFKDESTKNTVVGKKKYEKTIESLNKFKAVGDPFSGKVLKTQFELIFELQKSLMKAVKKTQENLTDEIASLKRATTVTTVICGVVGALLLVVGGALILTGVGAGVGLGMVLGGFADAAGWAVASSILSSNTEALEKKMERSKKLEKLADTIDEGVTVNKKSLENVSTQAERLERHIQTVLELAENATKAQDNEAKMRLYLEEICGLVEKLTKEIKDVGESVEKHIKLITKARLRVMEKIIS